VRFEPVGVEITANEDETVLQAAFRQGVSLMHGCNDHLEFILKVFPSGRFSSLLDESLVGTTLEVTSPYGSCVLLENSERDVVLIGGGARMAPLRSLLNDIAERGLKRRVTFYYGARARRDLFYLDKIKELTARLPEFLHPGFVRVASRRRLERRNRSHH
jgi:NAD(P)H-flavin reductase